MEVSTWNKFEYKKIWRKTQIDNIKLTVYNSFETRAGLFGVIWKDALFLRLFITFFVIEGGQTG